MYYASHRFCFKTWKKLFSNGWNVGFYKTWLQRFIVLIWIPHLFGGGTAALRRIVFEGLDNYYYPAVPTDKQVQKGHIQKEFTPQLYVMFYFIYFLISGVCFVLHCVFFCCFCVFLFTTSKTKNKKNWNFLFWVGFVCVLSI